jgi:hypothetical protein
MFRGTEQLGAVQRRVALEDEQHVARFRRHAAVLRLTAFQPARHATVGIPTDIFAGSQCRHRVFADRVEQLTR